MKNKIISAVYTTLAVIVMAAPAVFGTLAVMQLCHVINWSWWLVTSPLWGAMLIVLAVFLVHLILISAASIIRRKIRKGSRL